MSFPKKLYVAREEIGTEDEWLHTAENYEDLAEFGEPKDIAVYELVTEAQIRTEIVINNDQNV